MWYKALAPGSLFPFINGGSLEDTQTAAVAYFGNWVRIDAYGKPASLIGSVEIGTVREVQHVNPFKPPYLVWDTIVDRVTLRSFMEEQLTEAQLHEVNKDTRRRCYGQFPEDFCQPVDPTDEGLPDCENFRPLAKYPWGDHWASRFRYADYTPNMNGGWIIEQQFTTFQMGYLSNDVPESPCQTNYNVAVLNGAIGPFWQESVTASEFIYGPFGPITAGLADDPFPGAPLPEMPEPLIPDTTRTLLDLGRVQIQVTVDDGGYNLDPDIYYARWVTRMRVRDVRPPYDDLLVWDKAFIRPNDPEHHLIDTGRVRLSTIRQRPNEAFAGGIEREQVDSVWFYTRLPLIDLPEVPPLPLTPDLQIEDKTEIVRNKFQRYGMQVWTAIIQPQYRYIIAKPQGPEPVKVVLWQVQIEVTTWGVKEKTEHFLYPSDEGFAQTVELALTGGNVAIRVRAQDLYGRFSPWGTAYQYIGWFGEPLRDDNGNTFRGNDA